MGSSLELSTYAYYLNQYCFSITAIGMEADFVSTTQVLTFSPSSLAVQTTVIQIAIIDDRFMESTENLVGVLTLNTIDGAIHLQPSEASISIIDDDGMLIISINLVQLILGIISTSQICHHIY